MNTQPIQPPILPPRKKSFTWLIILVILLLLTSTSVLAYKYYQLKSQTAVVTPSPTPNQAISPELTAEQDATLDPTANWKIYTDEKSRFTFKYPNDSEVKNVNGRLSMYIEGFDYPLSIIPDGPHNWGEGMSKDQLDKIYMKQFQYPNDPDRKMFPDKDVQFVIEFLTLDDKKNASNYLSKIDQILSTFKFTD